TVARRELLVSGEHIFTLTTARRIAERRFAGIARRHGNAVRTLHVGDLTGFDVFLYCPLQLLLRPLEKAAAVADAFVLRIKPTINEIRHEPLSGAPGSARLVDPHVPIHQPAHLSFSIAASGHALDKFGMLLFSGGILFRAKADDRQQVFYLTEHALLDDFTHLLVACPGRVVAVVPGSRPQRKLHHLVAEVLRV